jgi:hypothetical protein
MSGIRKPITPLKLAIAYLLFIIFYLIKCNTEPSVAGWAYLIGMVYFVFALITLGIDALLIKYVKNDIAFWIIQMILFLLLVWLFVNEGLPGRL